MVFCWMQRKRFLLCGGNTLDKFIVKLYSRAYQGLDDIYIHIAENLLEPDTALNMIDELEKLF